MVVVGTHSRAWSCAWISTPGLRAVAVLADPQARIVYGAARHLALRRADALLVEEVGQRDRAGRRPRRCRCPRWCGTGAPGRSGPADWVSQRRPPPARPCSASAPAASLASRTRTALPVTSTASGRFGAGPVHELDRDVVAALVAPRRRGDDDRGLPGAADRGLRLALVAVGLVRQVDDLGDVRVLLGDLLGARVELLRVLVAVDEVATCRPGSPSAAAGRPQPVGDRRRSRRHRWSSVTRIWSGRVRRA